MKESTCAIYACGKPLYQRFLCGTHYSRLITTGSTRGRPRPKSPPCRMPGCNSVSRKHRWCTKHWSRIQRNGSPFDKDQKWTVGDCGPCVICGREVPPEVRMRRYCSTACAAARARRPGQVTKPCARCGAEIDLLKRNERGRLVHANTSYCVDCRRGVNLRAYVKRLLERDGNDCVLCMEPIDMSLKYPDPGSRSVDHKVPRSLGGTEDMENLGLAHLGCNVRKNARIDWKPAAV